MSALKKLIARIWRETTDADQARAAILPVQRGYAPCPTCWVRPGQRHELSCPEVSAEQFCRYLGIGGESR